MIVVNLYKKNKILSINEDSLTLKHVTTLMPWINVQVEKSTTVIFQNYVSLVERKILTKDIDQQTQNTIINSIRTHFYGTIPKSLSERLFKYVDQRQIDILIYTTFRKVNAGYFTIQKIEE